MTPTATDALIIGAGPVGLFQVFQLGLQGVKAHLVDALPYVGGQCAELYADKPIYDIPALRVCTGRELVERLQAQIAPMQASFHLGQLVESLQRLANGGFSVTTSGGAEFVTTTVFIAAGAGAFVPRAFPLADCQPYAGTQMHHHPSALQGAPDAAIVVFGGDDLALDWALGLAEQGRVVTLVHRRAQLQAQPELLARVHAAIANGLLRFVAGQPIAHAQTGGRLCNLTVALPDGGTQELAVDQLLVAPRSHIGGFRRHGADCAAASCSAGIHHHQQAPAPDFGRGLKRPSATQNGALARGWNQDGAQHHVHNQGFRVGKILRLQRRLAQHQADLAGPVGVDLG